MPGVGKKKVDLAELFQLAMRKQSVHQIRPEDARKNLGLVRLPTRLARDKGFFPQTSLIEGELGKMTSLNETHFGITLGKLAPHVRAEPASAAAAVAGSGVALQRQGSPRPVNAAAAQRLHVALACAAIGILSILLILLVPTNSNPEDDDPLATAQDAHDEAIGTRNAVLPWLGAGLAIGAGVGGGLGTLILWRRQTQRLEEGR
jgi:hypothetical protein